MTVWSSFTTQVSREGCGPDRPKGPQVRELRPADWAVWRAKVAGAVQDALGACGEGCVERAEVIQRVILPLLDLTT